MDGDPNAFREGSHLLGALYKVRGCNQIQAFAEEVAGNYVALRLINTRKTPCLHKETYGVAKIQLRNWNVLAPPPILADLVQYLFKLVIQAVLHHVDAPLGEIWVKGLPLQLVTLDGDCEGHGIRNPQRIRCSVFGVCRVLLVYPNHLMSLKGTASIFRVFITHERPRGH